MDYFVEAGWSIRFAYDEDSQKKPQFVVYLIQPCGGPDVGDEDLYTSGLTLEEAWTKARKVMEGLTPVEIES